MPRPKGHRSANGQVKPKAPRFPTTKPDVLKLARSTEDALTGIVWNDDAQTVHLALTKNYAAANAPCGAKITITTYDL